MFDSLMNQIPLTAEARALKDEILAIPITDEPMMDDVPEGFDLDTLDDLHRLALSGSQKAVPELRKLSARYPEFPKLLNYIYVAHTLRGERRQAEAAMKQLAKDHPDYLFTRIAFANKALDKRQPEQATAALNPTLSIRDLYPDRDLFHLSEIKNYYFCVARILAQRGDPHLARGVKAALSEIQPDENSEQIIANDIMIANLTATKKRLEEDERRRVTVRPVPLPTKPVSTPRPTFHHEEIADLYEFRVELSSVKIAKSDPTRLPEISKGLGEVLAFIIDSPAQDNILDTGYLYILIGTLAELRTTEHLPLIRKAYDKDLIEFFKVGKFEEVEEDMFKPITPPHKWRPMIEQYESYFDGGEVDDNDENDLPLYPPARHLPPASAFSSPLLGNTANHTAPSPVPFAGRNDPCPCGSGRKFKKCCLT